MANVGIWIPVMDDSEPAPYSLSQVTALFVKNSLTPAVEEILLHALTGISACWHAHLRNDYPVVAVTDSLHAFFEPVNERLFEVRVFSTLDLPEAHAAEIYHRYVGMDVYARAQTGLLYGVGMVETRIETSLQHSVPDFEVVRGDVAQRPLEAR